MPKSNLHVLPPLAALASVFASSASADTAQSRLELATELNGLVYEASASVCMIAAGVAIEQEMESLAAARTAFNTNLEMLKADDTVADGLLGIEAAWQPIDGAMSMILAGDTPAPYLDEIASAQPTLEFATLQLLDRTANEYEHAADVTMADVLTIDLAERQGVFVHQLKHQACMLAADSVQTDVVESLATTTMLFETSLDVLSEGKPEIGIPPSDSFEVNQALAATAYDWQQARPVLDQIALNGKATSEQLVKLRQSMEVLDGRVSVLVDYYLSVPEVVEPDAAVAALDTDTE